MPKRFGSSPRTRGTGGVVPGQPVRERFIPADAGNSPAGCRRGSPATVHPRGRGEQLTVRQEVSPADGSSPRARGTESTGDTDVSSSRFIPAGAGNSLKYCSWAAALSVHPRGRGEQGGQLVAGPVLAGSSPRARGTVVAGAELSPLHRFIPAGAGNSPAICPLPMATTVHPRGRGEQWACSAGVGPTIGSSPRARGTGSGGSHEL